MYGITNLKPHLNIDATTVECPVAGCTHKVDRQRNSFKKEARFQCPEHRIFISPSTFEYEKEEENLLWTDDSDMELFSAIKTVKRESRIARENSEDAVTWNVFRYLERQNLLPSFLNDYFSTSINTAEMILWSFSRQEYYSANGQKYTGWSELNSARLAFGETIARGSEPDIIINTDKALIFIEAKVTSGNDTSGSGENYDRHMKVPNGYTTGANGWYDQVFRSNYQTVVEAQKYELLRFWLLGTWMAKQMNKKFVLANLVLGDKEKSIEEEFGRHIRQGEAGFFKRISWEDIYQFVVKSGVSNSDTDKMLHYFRNKTLGYDGKGNLIKAFKI